MRGTEPHLTVDDARRIVHDLSFTPAGRGHGRVGLECEFLVYAVADPAEAPDPCVLAAVVASTPLPGGSRASLEPGGQVEVSTLPLPDVGAACTAAAADIAALEAALAAEGLVATGVGLDPLRPPRRVVRAPRYDAMEAFFDTDGSEGRRMMCGTASVQVNLDLGAPHEAEDRWRRAHAVGPVLAAAFANSAMAEGRPTGRRSTRLANWFAMDATRTAPVSPPTDAAAWVAYALDARVMLVREDDRRFVPVRRPLSLAGWLEGAPGLRRPTADDIAYHLTTLFPPVRPRRWLELRMIDALPAPWWRVAAAVTTALLDDPVAAAEADAATDEVAGLWGAAADCGLSEPRLARAARRCFLAALDALPRVGADPDTAAAAARYADQYVLRGRCPADDQLAAWHGRPEAVRSSWA